MDEENSVMFQLKLIVLSVGVFVVVGAMMGWF